jgi:hypothetical protein
VKRFLISSIVAGLALAGPLFASAATSTRSFSGTIDPSGTVSFKLKKHNGTRTIPGASPSKGFTFGSMPVDCDGGPDTTGGVVTFTIPVKDTGKFTIKAVAGNPQNPSSALLVKGDFNNKYTKASGTIRVHGSNVLISGNNHDACDSGTLDWSAQKQ